MAAIDVKKAKENLYKLIDEVNESSTPIIITNSRGKNAVLVSENDWNAIQETLYLMSIPGLVESIIEGGKTPIDDCLTQDNIY